ncbi:vacuolar protein sorting-associated protein 37C-like [Actinia tenebrosa]|uniref:Vacuolar protein sorting-associated protein 37C-like n=1 Tax=Actinia tenebrosa TaxID=6105 RepID=A0A6P8IHT9_ACTTE|nr:vacuolar protein sorting-associated protein 37C-like [Actinia tenebrosa]
MSNGPSLVSVPRLDCEKAVQDGMSLLQHLDKGELQEFMENDMVEVNVNNVIQDLEEIKKIQQLREMLIARNRSLAEYNLSLEPKLASGRERLIESHENRETLQAQFEINKQALANLSDQYSSDTTMALLQTATVQAEEEAEKTVDKFLEREIDVDTFIRTFQSQKALHHLRKVKSEKLNELLRQRTSSQCSYNL